MKNYNATRRIFLKISVFSLAALTFSLSISCSHSEQKRPNVLFIAVDDLNDWVGYMDGHPNTLTPNIDRLAKASMVFEKAYCQAPLCGPSRTSVMSGLRPSTTGIYGQIKDKDLRTENPTMQEATYLSEYFQQNGYKTMGVGKLFHGSDGNGAFEEYGGIFEKFGPKPKERVHYDPAWFKEKEGRTQTDWGAFPDSDEMMPDYKYAKWAIEKLDQTYDQPFFLAVGFVRPHVPWHVPQKWFDLFDVEKIETPAYLKDDLEDVPQISKKVHEVPMFPTTEWAKESGQWKDIVEAYLASTAFVDDKVGMVLQALEKSRYSDNTIVVLWSDHGYHLGEKNRFTKHSLWERATKVTFMLSGPGLPKDQTCAKPVGLIDIYPTLTDLCKLPKNTSLEGHSLLPLLRNPQADWDHPAITTYGRNNHAIRTEDFRYIHYEDGSEELYDHRNDPNEWHNLAGKKEHRDVIEQLKSYLPQKNAPWARGSYSNVNKYFRTEQNDAPGRHKK